MIRKQSSRKTMAGKGKKEGRDGASGMPRAPMEFEATFKSFKRLRFAAGSSGTITITRANLLDLMVLASGTTTAYRLFDAVKLNGIQIWGPVDTAEGAYETVSVQWLSTYAPAIVESASGIGTAFGPRLSTRPPAKSLAGFWSLTGISESDVLCVISGANSIIDLLLEFRIQNNLFAETAPASVTVTSATVGTVYCTYLDFVQNGSSSTVVPVSYLSIK